MTSYYYQTNGTNNDTANAGLYTCCAALRDATERTDGACVRTHSGRVVAFWSEWHGKVWPTTKATAEEKAIIHDANLLPEL